MQGPLCQYKYPLIVEDGTLCRMPSPLPGPAGVGSRQPRCNEAGISSNSDDLGMVFGGPAEEVDDASEGVFWEVFDCHEDWPGSGIPMEFKMRVGGEVFWVKAHATLKLYQYAATHFCGPGTFYSELQFPMSALAGALARVAGEGALAPLMEGKVDRLGTEKAPFNMGEWQFSFERGDGVVELFHAVYRGWEIA